MDCAFLVLVIVAAIAISTTEIGTMGMWKG
jgi:hypothetical protein